ncbi:4Fe-4S binding protein [bacterium]|nr:4Fe-4S binding protein [candidate division CSSED10-310 bacterium]
MIKWIRMVFQIGIILLVLFTGFRYAMGWSGTSIETYCPLGGLETALSLFTHQQFTCATGERNLALFVGLLFLTVLSRKAFCGWVCPIGAISEWIYKGTKYMFRGLGKRNDIYRNIPMEPTRKLDRRLRWIRLPVLLLILGFTFWTGELIFRGFDPYYVLFSFHGHDVKMWSYAIIGIVLLGIFIFPMAWCRYLCPLGVALWPFSKIGRLTIARSVEKCIRCGECSRACPHNLPVDEVAEVNSGECTLCLECVHVCPKEDILELHLKGLKR